MARATNARERSAQKEMLRQAAEGQMGKFKDMPPQMQKDLRANKTLYDRAVKNGVAPAERKPASRITKK